MIGLFSSKSKLKERIMAFIKDITQAKGTSKTDNEGMDVSKEDQGIKGVVVSPPGNKSSVEAAEGKERTIEDFVEASFLLKTQKKAGKEAPRMSFMVL
jgi:hypothetical protein